MFSVCSFDSTRVCVLVRCVRCKGLQVSDAAKTQLAQPAGADADASSSSATADMPTLVILGIAASALGLLLTNAALIAWLIIRKRNKGLCLLVCMCDSKKSVGIFRRPYHVAETTTDSTTAC